MKNLATEAVGRTVGPVEPPRGRAAFARRSGGRRWGGRTQLPRPPDGPPTPVEAPRRVTSGFCTGRCVVKGCPHTVLLADEAVRRTVWPLEPPEVPRSSAEDRPTDDAQKPHRGAPSLGTRSRRAPGARRSSTLDRWNRVPGRTLRARGRRREGGRALAPTWPAELQKTKEPRLNASGKPSVARRNPPEVGPPDSRKP